MPRTCTCNDLDHCSRCRVYEMDPAYAEWALLPRNGRHLRCRHRGAETRRVECPTCRGKVELKVFACAKHGECTAARPAPELACCASCPDYAASAPPIEWVSTRQLAEDSVRLAGRLPHNASGIVGIPRSGMIPASIIAAHLQLPLYELPHHGALQPLGHGWRGRLGWAGDRAGPLVVVDDTVYAGSALRRAREQMAGRPARFAAVYPIHSVLGLVDYYARVLPDVQLLEWNLFNNWPWGGGHVFPIFGAGVATDFDGVLCHDPDVPDGDAGPALDRYREWLINARPLHLPRLFACRLIVTSRLERWRPETEAWLRRWGVRWEKLVMHPAATIALRNRADDVAALKAGEYAQSRCGFFFESDPTQAAAIHGRTAKPVVCPPTGQVWA